MFTIINNYYDSILFTFNSYANYFLLHSYFEVISELVPTIVYCIVGFLLLLLIWRLTTSIQLTVGGGLFIYRWIFCSYFLYVYNFNDFLIFSFDVILYLISKKITLGCINNLVVLYFTSIVLYFWLLVFDVVIIFLIYRAKLIAAILKQYPWLFLTKSSYTYIQDWLFYCVQNYFYLICNCILVPSSYYFLIPLIQFLWSWSWKGFYEEDWDITPEMVETVLGFVLQVIDQFTNWINSFSLAAVFLDWIMKLFSSVLPALVSFVLGFYPTLALFGWLVTHFFGLVLIIQTLIALSYFVFIHICIYLIFYLPYALILGFIGFYLLCFNFLINLPYYILYFLNWCYPIMPFTLDGLVEFANALLAIRMNISIPLGWVYLCLINCMHAIIFCLFLLCYFFSGVEIMLQFIGAHAFETSLLVLFHLISFLSTYFYFSVDLFWSIVLYILTGLYYYIAEFVWLSFYYLYLVWLFIPHIPEFLHFFVEFIYIMGQTFLSWVNSKGMVLVKFFSSDLSIRLDYIWHCIITTHAYWLDAFKDLERAYNVRLDSGPLNSVYFQKPPFINIFAQITFPSYSLYLLDAFNNSYPLLKKCLGIMWENFCIYFFSYAHWPQQLTCFDFCRYLDQKAKVFSTGDGAYVSIIFHFFYIPYLKVVHTGIIHTYFGWIWKWEYPLTHVHLGYVLYYVYLVFFCFCCWLGYWVFYIICRTLALYLQPAKYQESYGYHWLYDPDLNLKLRQHYYFNFVESRLMILFCLSIFFMPYNDFLVYSIFLGYSFDSFFSSLYIFGVIAVRMRGQKASMHYDDEENGPFQITQSGFIVSILYLGIFFLIFNHEIVYEVYLFIKGF